MVIKVVGVNPRMVDAKLMGSELARLGLDPKGRFRSRSRGSWITCVSGFVVTRLRQRSMAGLQKIRTIRM